MTFELFFESKLLLWIHEHLRCGFLSSILIPYTHSGDIGLIWISIGIILLFFKDTRKAAIMGLCSFLVSYLLCDMGLKLLVNRTRPFDAIPELFALVERPRGSSFPSGHTSTAFGFVMGVFFYLRDTKKQWIRWVLLGMAVIMGLSRLYVGVHYPSDVLTGAVIGFTAVLLVSIVYQLIVKYRTGKKNSQD